MTNLNKKLMGPQKLKFRYMMASDVFEWASMRSLSSTRQPRVFFPERSGVDGGLVVKITANQEVMMFSANIFLDMVSSRFVRQITQANSVISLFSAVSSMEVSNEKFAELFAALSDQSGKCGESFDDILDELAVLMARLNRHTAEFTTDLEATVKFYGDGAIEVSKEIADLVKSNQENIENIVKGGDEAGASVKDLMEGMLTTISEAPADKVEKDEKAPAEGKKDESKDDKEAGGDKKKGVPSADYVITAINGTRDGVAKQSKALKDLERNNEILAKAYDKLAQTNAALAIAQAVLASHGMLYSAITDFNKEMVDLQQAWNDVSASLQEVSENLSGGDDHEKSSFKNSLVGATADWQTLATTLDEVKDNLITLHDRAIT
jgi:hypothetical protein